MNVHPSRPGSLPTMRQRLLAGAALAGALVVAAAPEAAHAQAINGTPAVVGGGAIIDRSVPGRDTITIDTNSAIIAWTPPNPPLPDPYIFLPAGTVVTFQNGASNTDFAVLNRILTNVPSRFEGSVVSQIISLGGGTAPGGTVFFSSPGGIVIGSTARFDVGNLVLTTLNVVDDGTPSGNFISAGGRYQFNGGGVLQPNAAVIIEPGAQILANSQNSYVALVAPRIEQGGSVFVNGSTAYIAAEQVEFSVNAGLFDIVVATGSDNANPIIHTGSTGGPSSGAAGDNHAVYFAAVAKNQAITMLLQGSVGYDPAVVAGVENGVVVLSAGYNVTGGSIDSTPVPALAASIAISDGNFTSDVIGRATGTASGTGTVADPLSFAGALDLEAVGAASLATGAGAVITVGEDLRLAGASVDIGAVSAGGSILTDSLGDTNIASASSGGTIHIDSVGAVDAGTLNAAGSVEVDPTNIDIDSVTAGGDIDLQASGDITVGFAQAGDDFTANAGGAFDGGTINAGGGSDNESDNLLSPLAGNNIDVDAGTDLRLDNGDAANAIRLTSNTTSVLSAGLLNAGTDVELTAPVAIDITNASAGRFIDLNAGALVDASALDAGDDILVSSDDDVTISAADSGGSILIGAGGVANLGTLTAVDDIIVDPISIFLASATAGGDITLDASQDITVGFAQAGDDFFATAGTTFTGTTLIALGLKDSELGSGPFGGGNIVVDAGGDLRVDNGTAPDDIRLTSTGGSIRSSGTLTANRLIASSPLNILLNDVFVTVTLDLSTLGGSIAGNSFNSDGDIFIDASGTVTLGTANSGGDIIIDAGGDLRLNNGTAPGLIDLASGGSILSSGTLTANQLVADAALDLRLGRVFVDQPLVLSTVNGDISGTSFNSDGDIDLDASDEINLAAADSGGSITLLGGGNVRLDQGTAAGAITLTSSGGSVLSGDRLDGGGSSDGLGSGPIGLLTAGTDILATAALDIFLEDALAGDDIVLDAGRDVGVRDLTADTVDVDALGIAGFAEDVSAPSISVISSDIDIAAGATLGNAGTQIVSLTVRPDPRLGPRQTVLGGATQGPGYTLTDAEANRITATTLNIQAPPVGTAANRPPDVLVRDLALSGQRIGLLQLITTGILQVEGGLLLAGVRPTGGIEIRATERVQVVTPTGSIRVRDASGLTAGSLLLFSNNIWSASQSLLDQLRANPDFVGRDQALLANNGPFQPRGYIEAGDVVLTARDTLFVQNSGTLSSFAGITVRQNTLRIVPSGTQPLKVFAFGRRINPDGSFVTNNAFFNEVVYQGRGGPVGYTDDAQFNLCFINTGVCRLPTPGNPLPGGSDIIEEPVDGSVNLSLPTTDDDLVDTSFSDEPLIEEPVTSGSDSILWDCDTDDDGDCDEDDTNG